MGSKGKQQKKKKTTPSKKEKAAAKRKENKQKQISSNFLTQYPFFFKKLIGKSTAHEIGREN